MILQLSDSQVPPNLQGPSLGWFQGTSALLGYSLVYRNCWCVSRFNASEKNCGISTISISTLTTYAATAPWTML